MKYHVEGNTEGVRDAMLARLDSLFGYELGQDEFLPRELMKLLVSRHPDYLRYAWSTGLTSIFLPEFDRMMETVQNNPHHSYNVGEHTLHALQFQPLFRLHTAHFFRM